MSTDGFFDPQFSEVVDVFEASFKGEPDAMTTELGASVAVHWNGKPVVDLWGGHMDDSRRRPWQKDTIVCVQSSSKGVLATCALILIDRGLLDTDKPIAHYWPEFGTKGKSALPVKWALTHQLGLPAWEHPVPGMGYNWERATMELARSAPDLVPGQDKAYHPYTFGFIVGKLVECISGKTVNQFLEDEITRPLNIDFHFGVKPGSNERVATFTKLRHGDNVAGISSFVAPQYADVMRRALDVLDPDEDYNSLEWRQAVIPAANGHTNGRALSQLYAVLSMAGEWNGIRTVSASAIDKVTTLQWGGMDLIVPMDTNVGLGYMLNCPSFYAGPNPRTFGHAGHGGSYGFADRDNRLSFGYTPNKLWLGARLETGQRCDDLVKAVYRCLAKQ